MLEDLRETVSTVSECRICRSETLVRRVDLGFTPIAYRLLDDKQLDEPEPYYPLQVSTCDECGLAQLRHEVDPALLYPPDYPYDMDTTRSAVEHFHGFAADAAAEVGITDGDLAIDIGSSTGVLLEGFKDFGASTLGVEPATEMAERARERGIDTVTEFFTPEVARDIRDRRGPATVITATNVINQIDDLNGFIEGIEVLLDEGGLFAFETPHLVDTLEGFHYDHIYHEHSTYLSLRPLRRLFDRHGMVISRVGKIPFRGGSLRCYAGRGEEHDEAVDLEGRIDRERDAGLYGQRSWGQFSNRVATHRDELNELVYSLKSEGSSIAAVSVTAKGNSLLNYCGLTKQDIDFATEIMDTKIGKYTPGGHVPIHHDDHLIEAQPDYAMIMAWNYADTIMDNLAGYRHAGGEFIVPVPEPTVVD